MFHVLAVVQFLASPHNLLWISGVVGFFLPHLVAIINQSHWNPGLKSILATFACLVAALIVCWSKGQLNFSDLSTSALIVYAFATTAYKGLWKPTGIIDAVESSTTLHASP